MAATEALLVFSCYLASVLLLIDVSPEVFLLYEGGLTRIGIMTAGMIVAVYFQDLYDDLRVRSRAFLLQQYCFVLGVGFLLQALLSYAAPQYMLPRWMVLTGSAFVLVLAPAWRILYSRALKQAYVRSVLFLGAGKLAADIARKLPGKTQLGLACAGYVDDGEHAPDSLPEGRLLGRVAELRRIVEETRPDLVAVAMPERRDRLPVAELLELKFSGQQIVEAAALYEAAFNRVSTLELRPSHLIFGTDLGPGSLTLRFQRLYSLAVAALGLLIGVPVVLVVAVLIKLTSQGPVLYRQQRVGLNGAFFTLYKFRSMYNNAESSTGAIWAKPDDPRVTPIGKWLRRYRLDEIPQLVNVLRGEMSIIGPRPERPEFVEALAEIVPFYRQRHCVKPGITGWAQINHKYGDTLEDTITKLEYDLYYIKHCSPAMDATILFQTIKVVLLGRGGQ